MYKKSKDTVENFLESGIDKKGTISLLYRIIDGTGETRPSAYKECKIVNLIQNRIWVELPEIKIDGLHVTFSNSPISQNRVELKLPDSQIVGTISGVVEGFERRDAKQKGSVYKFLAEISVEKIDGKKCDKNVNLTELFLKQEKVVSPNKLKAIIEDKTQNKFKESTVKHIRSILSSIPVFSGLKEKDYSEIFECIDLKPCSPGSVLVGQGSIRNSLFIINSGSFDVYITSGERENLLFKLIKGQIFGELSFLTGRPHTCSVIAREDSTFFELKRSDIGKYILRHPQVYKEVKKYCIEKAAKVAAVISASRVSRRYAVRLQVDFDAFVQVTFKGTKKISDFFECKVVNISQTGVRFLLKKECLPRYRIKNLSVKLNIPIPVCMTNILAAGDVMWHSTGEWTFEKHYEIGVRFAKELTSQQIGSIILEKYKINYLHINPDVIADAKKDKKIYSDLISYDNAVKYNIAPFKKGDKTICIALGDPFFMLRRERRILMQFKDKYKIRFFFASLNDIKKLQEMVYKDLK